ncbi:hypothetical protein V6N13_038526 [Hibiscus sabdariffa]
MASSRFMPYGAYPHSLVYPSLLQNPQQGFHMVQEIEPSIVVNPSDPTGTTSYTTNIAHPQQLQHHDHHEQASLYEDVNSLVGSLGSSLSLSGHTSVAPVGPDPCLTVGPVSPSICPLTNDIDEYPPPFIWDYMDPNFILDF